MHTFAKTLLEQRRGALLTELSEELQKLVEAVHTTNKAGVLTLKLTVRPTSDTELGTVLLEDDVIVKQPKPKRASSTFFVDEHHQLTRQNPNQPDLPMVHRTDIEKIS